MEPSKAFTRIIGRKRYSVSTAALLASDNFWDGNNFERHGRNTFLYRTPNGAYFKIALTQWQGEVDSLTPLSLDEAIELYEGALSEHYEDYSVAFPSVKVEEA